MSGKTPTPHFLPFLIVWHNHIKQSGHKFCKVINSLDFKDWILGIDWRGLDRQISTAHRERWKTHLKGTSQRPIYCLQLPCPRGNYLPLVHSSKILGDPDPQPIPASQSQGFFCAKRDCFIFCNPIPLSLRTLPRGERGSGCITLLLLQAPSQGPSNLHQDARTAFTLLLGMQYTSQPSPKKSRD